MIGIVSSLLSPYNFRGKARILHSLCPRQREKLVNLFGYKVTLDLSDYIQRSIYLGVFEPYETAIIAGYLKSGMTFVDVGANIGYFTLVAASLVGDEGKILAFEPSSYAYERLAKAIIQNNLSQVCSYQSGLGDLSGELQLYIPKNIGNHSPSMVANDGGTPTNVPIGKLDDYLTRNEVDHVDLLKIDVEGFEPNVIRGTMGYIERGKVHTILCEFNKFWLEQNKSSPMKLYETLINIGFKAETKNLNFDVGNQNIFFTRV